MSIPVEHIGSERQRIPAVLIKIEKSMGLIKYAPRHTPLKVPLSELQLAPSAFEPFHENVYSHTEVCELGSPIKTWTGKDEQRLNPREPGEIWLTTEATSKKKPSLPESSECTEQKLEESPSSLVNSPAGAWWPGRVLNIHGGFVHVEVAAPLAESGNMDDLTTPHVVRMGSSLLPFRSTIVRLGEVRPLWTGRPAPVQSAATGEQPKHGASKDAFSEQYMLATPGVLNRHTICIPAYLARLATSMDAHAALIKFCDAPCLVQCDPEPFLSHVLVKRILADGASAAASGRQTPCQDTDSNLGVPSVAVPANSQTVNAPWPSACTISQSPLLNPPNIAGTLSPAGVTDPTLLLEGLPGANGPLVLLHIWSGSPEAIRRAGLLELAHVRILVFRYHVMRKLSNGEPGELDLADSTDAPTENGDAPVMHCKPISIPVHPNPDDPSAAPSGMMIGYSAQFRIQPQLIGLAIGYRGATIHEARALPGVRNVDLLHDGIVHIEAETVEACQAVRNLLDFTEAEIPVSPRLASRLIGSKGMNIRKLATSAGVRRAQLLDPLMRKRRQQQQQLNRQQAAPLSDRDQFDAFIDAGRNGQNADGDGVEHTGHADAVEQDVPSANGESSASPAANSEDEKLPPPAFYLLGTRPAVAKMRLLLEFQADNWNELDELEETRRSLFTQLRQSNQQSTRMGTLPPTSGSDAPAQGGPGPTGPRGRGRRTSGRGGSADGAPDHDQLPQQSNFPRPFRGRGRGGPVNGGPNGRPSAPPNRFNREPDGPSHPNEEHHDNMPQKPEVDDDHAVHNGWQPVPPKVGMTNGSGPRGRGRNRPRNQPINS